MSSYSPLFNNFIELQTTSQCFRYDNFAYFTIKQYTFQMMNYYINQNKNSLSQMEYSEFDKQYKIFNSELSYVNKQKYTYDKPNFEAFVSNSFKTINFENSDRPTLVIARSLISVLSLFGPISDYFLNLQKYINQKISLIDSQNVNSTPINPMAANSKFTPTISNNVINSNPNLAEFISGNKDQNNKNNNNLNVQSENSNKNLSNTNKPLAKKKESMINIKKKKEEEIDKRSNPFMPGENVFIGSNNRGNVSFDSLINRNIKFPITKDTMEYKYLKQVIKEHLMYAEQEALYNKIDNSKAHMKVAIYYLKQIQH